MNSALVFNEIEISGFLSFPPNRPQKLNLNTGKITTIVGENVDIGDGERNGAGKSAITDALLYLYFGKSPRISNQGLVNYVTPGPLLVCGTAERNGIAFRVERGENPSLLRLFEKPASDLLDFRHKVGNKFVFETTKSSKPETTRRIVELIGFDLKLSDVLLISNPSDRSCFFLKNEDEQRTIIERIFGFTVFSEKADRLREIRKEENRELAARESALVATQEANRRVTARITALEIKAIAWDTERKTTIDSLMAQIAKHKTIDFAHEMAILQQKEHFEALILQIASDLRIQRQAHSALDQKQRLWEAQRARQISTLSATIEQMSKIDAAMEIEIIKQRSELTQEAHRLSSELHAAQREREPYQRAIESAAHQKTRLGNQVAAIEQQIIQVNEYKCPTCGQDWADTQNHTLKLVEQLDTIVQEISDCDTRMTELRSTIKTIDNHIDRINIRCRGVQETLDTMPTTTFHAIEDAARASESLEEHRLKLDEFVSADNPHAELLANTISRVMELERQSSAVRLDIDKLPKTRFACTADAAAVAQVLANAQQQWQSLQDTENPFNETIEELKTQALQQVDDAEIVNLRRRVDHMTLLISLLADRDSPIRKAILAEWLPELNRRANEYLDELELHHRVNFDQNMGASFTHDGNILAFGNLSTGQRLRAWLATNLAFRDIFELINYKVKLFFVDEVLDKGMSGRGAEASYQVLQKLSNQDRSIFLITHRMELSDLADDQITVRLENRMSTILTQCPEQS